MAFKNGPNKTVAAARNGKMPFANRERVRGYDEFHVWLVAQAKAGHDFATIEDARTEFEQRKPQA